MAIPSHIAKELRRTMGPDTGGDFVTWLDEMRAEHQLLLARIDDRFAKFEARMDDRFAKVDERFAQVDERLAGLQVAIADSKAELMKWMFVFWVGAVLSIAALAGILRP